MRYTPAMTHRTLLIAALLPLTLLACTPKKTIASFADCAAAGYPVLESYPRQCKTPDGNSFTEEVHNTGNSDGLIRVTSPTTNAVIEGRLSIDGEARGTWFFEASFPIVLLDSDGNELATVVAQAQGEWMTEDFVPFHTELVIPATTMATGTLVFHNDNPSGLPEHARELRIPVRFR